MVLRPHVYAALTCRKIQRQSLKRHHHLDSITRRPGDISSSSSPRRFTRSRCRNSRKRRQGAMAGWLIATIAARIGLDSWLGMFRAGCQGCLAYVMHAKKATLSGYHSYCLARGLCIRWLTFYSLPSTLIRSLSLQAFAFPLTHWSLTFLCRSQPLAGWTLCALTSLFSDILKIWVLSSLRDLTGIRKRELLKQRKGGPQSVTVRARELRLGTVLHKGLPASILLVISNVALLFTLAEVRSNV